MPVQFEWKVKENGADQTIAEIRPRRLPGWFIKATRIALSAVIVTVGVTWAVLRFRYVRAKAEALEAIETVIALEAESFTAGDEGLFLSLQDTGASDWYALQSFRIEPGCAKGPACPDHRFPALCSNDPVIDEHREETLQRVCSPVSPAKITDLELRGNVAWVEVVEADPPVQRARFYVRTATGWKHTAPQPEFWGKPVRAVHRFATLNYHRRDQPHVEPIIEHILQVTTDVQNDVRYWPSSSRMNIEFDIQSTALQAPYIIHRPGASYSTLVLASPWLSGIPINGTWDDAVRDQLTHWSTYGLLASDVWEAAEEGSLSQLQKAVISEYIAYSVHRDTARVPILGRIIERRGEQALPRVFLSLRGAHLAGLFLLRWLSIHPQDPAYMKLLLDVEQEAILAGQRETFLLLQAPEWLSSQAGYYDQSQIVNPYAPGSVEVLSVDFRGESARAQLALPPMPLDGYPLQTLDGYAYFTQHNWDWKRASTDMAEQWTAQPSVSAEPTPVPQGAEDIP